VHIRLLFTGHEIMKPKPWDDKSLADAMASRTGPHKCTNDTIETVFTLVCHQAGHVWHDHVQSTSATAEYQSTNQCSLAQTRQVPYEWGHRYGNMSRTARSMYTDTHSCPKNTPQVYRAYHFKCSLRFTSLLDTLDICKQEKITTGKLFKTVNSRELLKK